MKRKFLTILLFLVYQLVVSQVCSGVFQLRTQTDVINFATNNCTTIDGSLLIDTFDNGNDPISDLSPLSGLQIITESLTIRQNDFLINLDGLDNLIAVGPQSTALPNSSLSLHIDSNINLNSIQALSGLVFLRILAIQNNPSLSSFEGLNNLANVTQNLIITGNNVLADLDGLRGLTVTDTGSDSLFVSISNNNLLSNLNGLSEWKVFVTDLTLVNNPSLVSIIGISEIKQVNNLNNHDVTDNTSLTDFCGFFEFAATAAPNSITISNNGIVISQQQIIANGSCFVDIPNQKFEQALIDRNIDSDGIINQRVLKTDIENRTFLNLTGNPGTEPETNPNNIIRLDIEDLTGIEGFTNLQTLFVQGNDLTTLDLSNNKELVDVRAFNNDVLQSININGLDKLEVIGLNNNLISSIDVSSNISLTTLDIANNQLTDLNISNLVALNSINVRDNTDLDCVLVDSEATANTYNNDSNFLKNGSTTFSANCNPIYDVQVSVSSTREQDVNGFFVLRSANEPITLEFQALDQNGQELSAALLSDYTIQITTFEDPVRNTATGGDTSAPGVDFELLTNQAQNITVQNGQVDLLRPIVMQGDPLFEADEYFIIEVTEADARINLKDSAGGVVRFPVRIIDNEVTNVNLEVVDNGIEGSQNVKLRITSSLQNDTGAPMPFEIALQNGTATEGLDFQLGSNLFQLPNGQSSVDVDITVNNDTDATEGTENFTATMSYTGSIDTNRVNIITGTVSPTITDNTTAQPFVVTANITGAGTSPNYEIIEGQSFELNFDTGTTGVDGVTYNPNISITKDGSETSEDFAIDDLNRVFTVSSDNPDGTIVFTATQDGVPESDEIYLITISSEDNNLYGIANPFSFEIKIKDTTTSDETVSFTAELVGGTQDNNGNYTINEGENLEIWINAEQPNNSQGRTLSFDYDISTSGDLNDYSIISEKPFSFSVDNTLNPDDTLIIQINADDLNDPDETLTINLQGTPFVDWVDGYTLDGSGLSQITFNISINNITSATTDIIAEIDNLGGTEGGVDDVFTLKLTNRDDTPYIASQDIVFPVVFNAIDAEPSDFMPQSTSFTVLANTSSASINVALPDETGVEQDSEHEYYMITVEPSTNFNSSISLPEPLKAKIIDDEGKFKVSLTISPNVEFSDDTGQDCCSYYRAEEGQSVVFSFNAEKGVPENTNYKVELSYGPPTFPEFIDQGAEGEDFRTDFNPASQKVFTWQANADIDGRPDNQLAIQIESDSEEESEGVRINFSPVSGENFEFDFSELKRGSSIDILMLDVIPVELTTSIDTATENPLTVGEFTVTLDKINDNTFPQRIFYELDASSTASTENNIDFETLPGFVEIGFGEISAQIVINPINDDVVEMPETVVLRLLDRSGYSIKGPGIASVTIESDDIADYVATMTEAIDNKSRESDASDFAEIIIELDKVPETDVEILIKISDITDLASVQEGLDYTIYQSDKITPITLPDRKVIFNAADGLKTKSIFVKALLDDDLESNENLFITLDNGANYSIGSPSTAEVELISSVSDTSNFNPRDVEVIAKSPRCPGDDQEGSIFLQNASPFNFEITVQGIDNTQYNKTLSLTKNDSSDNTQEFEELSLGTYTVSLKFIQETGIEPPNIILPNYTIKISAFEGMIVEEEGFDGQLVNLKVSGSTNYSVLSNKNTYSFEFSDTLEKTIKVPLEEGLNNLSITGDAACKGIIEKNFLINSVSVYPNPAHESVNIFGSSLLGRVRVKLFNMEGRLVFDEELMNSVGQMSIDLSSLGSGIYLGRIIDTYENTIDFKLIKY